MANSGPGAPHLKDYFRKFAMVASDFVGSPWAFLAAILIVVSWAVIGPVFHFSDTWQLVINTGTTIVTFLMVFLLQNTQNRDAKAIHLKLDELIRGVHGARTRLVRLEELSDDELEHLQQQFHRLHERLSNSDDTAKHQERLTVSAGETGASRGSARRSPRAA